MNSENMSRNQKISRREFLKLLCLAAMASTESSNILPARSPAKAKVGSGKPNVLILVFDTLSARHMSTFGYPRQTTPNISKFAERALVYHNHYTAGNFTSPGTASILTGVHPWTHRALQVYGTVSNHLIDKNLFSYCESSHYINTYTHNSVAQILLYQFKDHIDKLEKVDRLCLVGELYSEKFFASDFQSALWSEVILRRSGEFTPGSLFFSKIDFQYLWRKLLSVAPDYIHDYPEGLPYTTRGLFFNLEHAIDWIQEQVLSLPQSYLSYYHLFPPHGPHRPRSDFINIFDDGYEPIYKPEHKFTSGATEELILHDRQKYDEYITFVDSEFGRLYDFMDINGVLDNTIVILTSDHGELFERGIIGHFTQVMYQDLVRIPLLISLPKQTTRQDITTPTSSVDLVPTILSLLGYEIPEMLEGQVLPGLSISKEKQNRNIYIVEGKTNSKFRPLEVGTIAMVNDRYKLVHYLGYSDQVPHELYDLENDPEELENQYLHKSTISKEMEFELLEQLRKGNQQDYD